MKIIELQIMDTNKDLVQSFKMTTIRNSFGLYGQRTITRLVEASQHLLEGKSIGDCVTYLVEKSLWGDVRVKMPISAILRKGDESNYQEAKKQLKKLVGLPLEYEAPNGDWVCTTLISKVVFSRSAGEATLTIQPEIWEAILDFSKGFRRFEIEKALDLRSAYSMRIYQLISGQERPLSYNLVALKKMLGVEKKYDRPTDFIKRVIQPAKEELDKVSPYTFDFKPILEKNGGRGRGTITGITFIPYFQPKNRDQELEQKQDFGKLKRKYPGVVSLPKSLENYLTHTAGFTMTGIKNNSELLLQAINHITDFEEVVLRKIVGRSREAKNPQGYIIKAIKSELKQQGIKA